MSLVLSIPLDLRPPMFQKHIFKKEHFGIVICFEWRIKSNASNRKRLCKNSKKYQSRLSMDKA
jgi:hypothetical protein